MSSLNLNQARFAMSGYDRGLGWFTSAQERVCNTKPKGDPWRVAAERGFAEMLDSVKKLDEKVVYLQSKITPIKNEMDALIFSPLVAQIEQAVRAASGLQTFSSAESGGPRARIMAMADEAKQAAAVIGDAAESLNKTKSDIRALDSMAGGKFPPWVCYWGDFSATHVSAVIAPARDAVDAARAKILAAERQADVEGLARRIRLMKEDLDRQLADAQAAAQRVADVEAAKQAEINAAKAAAQAQADALAAEQAAARQAAADAAAAAAAAAQAKIDAAAAQAQAQAEMEARKLDAQLQREQAQAEIQLRRLEMELQIEQQKLQFEMEKLQREEERMAARSERESQKEELMFQLELAKAGLAPMPGASPYAATPQGAMWTPSGAPEFAFSPGMAPAAAPSYAATPYAQQVAQIQAAQMAAQSSMRATEAQGMPGAAPPPPPVVSPVAPQPQPSVPGFEFESSWAVPSGQLFGMSGLVRALNPQLPAGSLVENGYKIHGPDASGAFTVERPDASKFQLSVAQASKPGVKIQDPKTGNVFYQAGSGADDGVTVEDVTNWTTAITGAVGAAANVVANTYRQATGKQPPVVQSTPAASIGGGLQAWAGPILLLGGIGVAIALFNRKK